jgi:hypothetical protein
MRLGGSRSITNPASANRRATGAYQPLAEPLAVSGVAPRVRDPGMLDERVLMAGQARHMPRGALQHRQPAVRAQRRERLGEHRTQIRADIRIPGQGHHARS